MAYYDPLLSTDEVKNNLLGLDREVQLICFENNIDLHGRMYKVIIAGSSSLILNGINLIMSQDIDVLRLEAQLTGELLAKYNMNTRITTYENCLPYNCEDRVVKLDLETKVLDYYALSIEDAVAGKIYAWRGKDQDHLYNEELLRRIDWQKLRDAIIDLEWSVLNESDMEWVKTRFNVYARRTGHEEFVFEDVRKKLHV